MANIKGSPKTGGRQIGSVNKITAKYRRDVASLCEELKCDPFKIQALIANGDWEALGYDSSVYVRESADGKSTSLGYVLPPELRQRAAKELCEYISPKLRAIEHSGEILNPYSHMSKEELEALGKKRFSK